MIKAVVDTLNCKVEWVDWGLSQHLNVEDTLNCEVVTTNSCSNAEQLMVEETLNCKVDSTYPGSSNNDKSRCGRRYPKL